MNLLLIPLIISVLLLFGSLIFGFWAYTSRQDYKHNTEQKIAEAVEIAREETASQKDSEFIEREKRPFRDYNGPSALGNITITYPRTWAAYVEEEGSGSTELDGYFHPNFVPDTGSDTSFALRVEVVDNSFDSELQRLENDVSRGHLTSEPFQPINVEDVTGMRFEGEVQRDKQGVMVLLPVRDKTLKLWTEAEQYRDDFDSIILEEFSFQP